MAAGTSASSQPAKGLASRCTSGASIAATNGAMATSAMLACRSITKGPILPVADSVNRAVARPYRLGPPRQVQTGPIAALSNPYDAALIGPFFAGGHALCE